MATITRYQDKKGKTLYRVNYRTPERKQTTKRGFSTKKAAQDFAATVHVSKLRGEFIDASEGKITVGELGAAWLSRQTHLKPSSARTVSVAWRVHVEPRWGSVRIADIKHSSVQQWVSDMSAKSGPVTVIRAYGAFAAILDEAIKDRRLVANPARGVKLPRKTKAEHSYLSDPQVWQFVSAAGPEKGTIVLVLAYCGLRWGELAALRVSDIDMLRRRIHVRRNAVNVGGTVVIGTPKTHELRAMTFPKFLTEALAAACAGKGRNDIVFPNARGGYAKSPGARTWFSHAVDRCIASTAHRRDEEERQEGEATTPEFPRVTPHDLRHTAASLAVSAGANVKAVQKMLGHASAAMTLDTYADLFDSDAEAVADAHDSRVLESDVVKMWSRAT